MAITAETIDEYIARFPPEVQKRLRELKDFIKTESPDAVEKISYGMPTFYLHGNLVHFAAFKDHYGFFPAPSGIESCIEELAPYRTGKGTLRFSLTEPFPWDILRKVIRFRIRENTEKARARAQKAAKKTAVKKTSV
ncbi:MAG: DUF1801 domain-containing protein [Spirochaetales bacterium]|jgi:uncharacterized protein YdhG (YjbR/CyaY superfamily)|nr:DUF1801 domain-containing protein [Spirochaetales bacterium]